MGLTDILSLQHSELNYRVLEADDLEQAELLARVWHPDVVLLDAAKVADPLDLLTQFSLHPHLISLPLVTLDHQTTEAANHVTGLSVYPCLAPDNSSKMAALLQVIQVAAGISRMPSILVMDIGNQGLTDMLEDSPSKILSSQGFRNKNSSLSSCHNEGVVRTHKSTQEGGDAFGGTLSYSTSSALQYGFSPGGREPLPCGNNSVERGTRSDHRTPAGRSRSARTAGGKGNKVSIAPSLAPHSSWLQALMQYLQTAGFRSVLSDSWIETYRQLQDQSVDLLLIRLKDISDASALANGLIALTQLQKLPPILVLDHRVHADSASSAAHEEQALAKLRVDAAMMGGGRSTANLDSLLAAISTQILGGHSLTMTQLLDQINQALAI